MNWKRSCRLRRRPDLLEEILLTDSQWQAYLRILHTRVGEALKAAALVLEQSP